MRRFIMMITVLAAWAQGATTGAMAATRYEIVPGSGTEVVFESRAPMEKFEGRTGQVGGWLEADLDDLTAPFELAVTVDLASFDTGIGKRNGHMRENHLETGKFPTAVFSGGELAAGSVTAVPIGGPITLQLHGTLDLHGVTRGMTCSLELERPDKETLHVTARFDVLLSDHRIERPKFLMLKMAEDQKVTARLVLQKGP